MIHRQLFALLQSYGTLSDNEKSFIERSFKPLKTKRKQILLERYNPANKLFFVNKGYLRAYYINENGKEITRMIAWENRFLTNLANFRSNFQNNEQIESITNSEILYVTKKDFENLISFSPNLKNIYVEILEEYNALHIKRFETLNTFDIQEKLEHLKKDFPHLVKELSDKLLASFLGVSRIHYVNHKHLL